MFSLLFLLMYVPMSKVITHNISLHVGNGQVRATGPCSTYSRREVLARISSELNLSLTEMQRRRTFSRSFCSLGKRMARWSPSSKYCCKYTFISMWRKLEKKRTGSIHSFQCLYEQGLRPPVLIFVQSKTRAAQLLHLLCECQFA